MSAALSYRALPDVAHRTAFATADLSSARLCRYNVCSWGTTVKRIETYEPSFAVLQMPADDSWNPSKYLKTEFHSLPGGDWAYCDSIYGLDNASQALLAETSELYDAANATHGCGATGFPHSLLTPYALPIRGTWATNFGATLTISNGAWESVHESWGTSIYRIEAYGDNWVLMQNSADDTWNPSKYSKVEWHTSGSGFGYCISVYDGSDSVSALSADTSAIYDAANATNGCNGFSHTFTSPAQ